MEKPPSARWSTGTSDSSLDRALRDQAILNQGRMKATDSETRYTPAGLSRSHYDALRMDRDDLDFREWNEETGYHGVDRWPTGPGMSGQEAESTTEAERRRARLRREVDEGF